MLREMRCICHNPFLWTQLMYVFTSMQVVAMHTKALWTQNQSGRFVAISPNTADDEIRFVISRTKIGYGYWTPVLTLPYYLQLIERERF